MNDNLAKLFTAPTVNIKDAMKQMATTGEKILIVIDQNQHLLGTLTDGDIRRFILKNGGIKGQIDQCYRKTPIFLRAGDKKDKAKRLMIENKIGAIPVVDKDNQVIDILIWNNIFNGGETHVEKIDVPVVIMAGGKGKRLVPFTKILPKPLIPFGEKPILEVIMDKFSLYGVRDFYVTVNYKGAMIKSYFENVDLKYNLIFIWEKEYLGTAGSLRLLPEDFSSTFIISNCDIILDVDYSDLLNFHKKNKNDLTTIVSFWHQVIPYGVIEFSNNGIVKKITEKPEYDFTINTGVYVIGKEILTYIPKNKFFHITHLMEDLLKDGKKIGIYPVSERSYVDIGQWEDYRENVGKLF